MCGRKKPSFLNLLLPFLLLPMVEDESVLMSIQSLRERIYCSHVSTCSHANEGRHLIASLSRDIGNSLANAISKITHIPSYDCISQFLPVIFNMKNRNPIF